MATGIDSTLGSDTFHTEPTPSPFPFPIQLIIAFLAFDGLERVGEIGLLFWQAQHALEPMVNPYHAPIPVSMLWIVVDFLLPLLLILRTQAGRMLTQVIFGIHLLYLAHVFVIKFPFLWLYMGNLGRARIITTLVIDAAALAYLFSRQARTYLNR